jgi:putative toxin-antitoxin system antitoxin component (TIGR02293 family)
MSAVIGTSQARAGESARVAEPGRAALYFAIGAILGLRSAVASEVDLAARVERGLPASAVGAVREHLGLADDEIYRLVAPRRTLARRQAGRQPLTPEESERLLRVARIAAHAEQVFPGEPEYAREWLREPKRQLADRAPIDVLATEPGARAVEELLAGIEHGLFA